jgi:hypothetical protein
MSVLLFARIACRRFTKKGWRMLRFPRDAMLFQQGHQAGVFSSQTFALLTELTISSGITSHARFLLSRAVEQAS